MNQVELLSRDLVFPRALTAAAIWTCSIAIGVLFASDVSDCSGFAVGISEARQTQVDGKGAEKEGTATDSKQPAQAKTEGPEELDRSEQLDQDEQAEHDEVQRHRLVVVAAICGAILGVVLILFSYFRLNHLTRGFYAGRLQLFALVLLIALCALTFWFIQRFGST